MRKFGFLAAFILIAAVGWWFASPGYTLGKMRDAAEAKDAAGLSSYIDYPALRADLKAEIGAAMTAEAGKGGDEALGAAFAAAFIGPMIDATITPEAMEAAFANKEASDDTMLPMMGGTDDPEIERDGLNRFIVRGTEDDGGMVFERVGLGWKLVGVELPETPLK